MQNLIIKKPKVAVLRTKGLFEEYADLVAATATI